MQSTLVISEISLKPQMNPNPPDYNHLTSTLFRLCYFQHSFLFQPLLNQLLFYPDMLDIGPWTISNEEVFTDPPSQEALDKWTNKHSGEFSNINTYIRYEKLSYRQYSLDLIKMNGNSMKS